MGLNTSLTTYIKLSPVSYIHRSDREHDDIMCISILSYIYIHYTTLDITQLNSIIRLYNQPIYHAFSWGYGV